MSLEELKQKKNKAFNTFNQYTKAQEIAFNEYRDVCREYRKAEQVDSNNKAYEEWILNKTMVYCICGLRGDVNITDFYAPEFTILKENLKNILKENLDQDVAVVRVESIIKGSIFSIYKNTKIESLLKGASIDRVLDRLVEDNEAFGYKSHQSALNAYQAGKKMSGGINRPQGRPKKPNRENAFSGD